MRTSMSIALDRPHAGDLVGYWRNGRPIYLPGGGSTPPEPTQPPAGGPPPPSGVIPVTIPPAPPAPPTPITAETLASLQAQWQADSEARVAAREAELQQQFEARLAPFEQERAERDRIAAEEQAERERLERERIQAEETAAQRMERLQQETEARLANYEAQLAQRDEVLRREQERNAVMEYRSAQLLAHAEDIHPAMHELVGGFTREDIDASITRAQAATQKMLDEFAAAQGQQQQQLAAYQRAVPGTSVTAPASGPIEALGSSRMLSPAELAALTPQQYEQLRPQLLAAASAAYHGNGNGQ